jgi:hypothetical protein
MIKRNLVPACNDPLEMADERHISIVLNVVKKKVNYERETANFFQ